jgi:hypothetical protein
MFGVLDSFPRLLVQWLILIYDYIKLFKQIKFHSNLGQVVFQMFQRLECPIIRCLLYCLNRSTGVLSPNIYHILIGKNIFITNQVCFAVRHRLSVCLRVVRCIMCTTVRRHVWWHWILKTHCTFLSNIEDALYFCSPETDWLSESFFHLKMLFSNIFYCKFDIFLMF